MKGCISVAVECASKKSLIAGTVICPAGIFGVLDGQYYEELQDLILNQSYYVVNFEDLRRMPPKIKRLDSVWSVPAYSLRRNDLRVHCRNSKLTRAEFDECMQNSIPTLEKQTDLSIPTLEKQTDLSRTDIGWKKSTGLKTTGNKTNGERSLNDKKAVEGNSNRPRTT
ncbi:hypothetical protein GNI_068550 [Gregarina niphandrodes]|uniref:Uncharacterized protein n=1 Tax=Gregarina niphandrodes TaxID=110365 RepID=A0A023B7K3_GRENI|nr:hypothetical protein GNI_068550 [Gregarina niphandrodes]EZG67516.1 hypothetical protein GNI_068550 [Gregarina niphandrodes]|eukprot:XP_011130231.1 hypothetical protein GNI_068550 [Gregarina niphandrodes]